MAYHYFDSKLLIIVAIHFYNYHNCKEIPLKNCHIVLSMDNKGSIKGDNYREARAL